MDLVSIITPSYNSQKYITQTIISVINQTYKNWEMIIVDDSSSDKSVKIIKEFMEKDNRIKLIQLEKNYGAAIARNKAIDYANGRYIAFLDSDDLWKSFKLERQISFMSKNNLNFTYSSYDVIDSNNKLITTFYTKKYITYISLLKTCSIGCSTVIYDTKKLGKVFMPLIDKRQDYGLWLTILRKIQKTEGVLESLSSYRVHNTSLSSNKLKAAYYQWKIYTQFEKLNYFKSIYYFSNYAYNGFLKYKK